MTFRDTFLHVLSKYKDYPLIFSGGVDSSTILFGLLELKDHKDIRAYNFRYGNTVSKDNIYAKRICDKFDVKLKFVDVPSDLETTIQDIKLVYSKTHKLLKTHIQVGIPFMYLCERIHDDGFDHAITGLGADTILGTSKNACIQYHKNGNQGFYQYRLKDSLNPNSSELSCIKIAKFYGINLCNIYRDSKISEFLLSKTFDEIHKPRQKQILLDLFPNIWKENDFYRTNSNLQIASGIRDNHKKLLDSEINKNHRISEIKLYQDIIKDSEDW